ncbi:hypothetical protein PC119_g1160 [Phytophthora cactorum]|nr:hypothetical protein PC111_g5975 [Phytophthora cactorum]KAG3028107.1 hypothetical protein PC120_g5038 [Phytophthora cactorum]KAG3040768.1 hypothetical protein PC119_g1160 [Phytophthora cactorum]KAG3097987.1 hypothetical protein PC121_g2124 [Phytophthora cactorum]KAG4057668.1 hypothetical protein PC123_g7370 [Phytophthora cactorum]
MRTRLAFVSSDSIVLCTLLGGIFSFTSALVAFARIQCRHKFKAPPLLAAVVDKHLVSPYPVSVGALFLCL